MKETLRAFGFLLTVGVLMGAGPAFAKPVIIDGSLIGWWRFDNSSDYTLDSSGYGSHLTSVANGTGSSSGGYGGGKMNLAKSKTLTATIADAAPAIPGTLMPYYTMATRFKSGSNKILSGISTMLINSEIKNVINDTSSWHFGALRYQNKKDNSESLPHTGSGSYTYAVILDPRYNEEQNWIKADGSTDTTRNLEMGSTSPDFLMSYSGKTVTIGGSLKGQSWWGDLDEIMVFPRMLTKRELSRLRYTGETYVYCTGSAPSFSAASGWSCCEGTYSYVPGGAFGVAYIVDNDLTMSQGGTATFGGNVANHVSLTLGRTADLTYMNGNANRTVTKTGNFNHGSAGTLTFYDIRFVNGTYTAAGTGLTTTLLDVDTPLGSEFNFKVTSSAYALSVTSDTTGTGVLAKQGAGRLTVNKWSGTAKLRMTAGTIKTPRLNGYTGGTVLVDTTTPVEFVADDTVSGTVALRFDGTAPGAGTYTVMTVPAGRFTAANFSDSTAYSGGLTSTISVEGTAVKVTVAAPTPVYISGASSASANEIVLVNNKGSVYALKEASSPAFDSSVSTVASIVPSATGSAVRYFKVDVGGSLSENTLGLLRVDSKTKATIVAVPWVKLSENSSSSISVADVVMTAGLTNGDKLYAYPAGARSNSAAYQVWTLSNGAWTPVTTYVQAGTGSTTQNQAGEAVSTYLPRGSAFWLERQNANTPFYLYGQYASETVAAPTISVGTASAPVHTLLANPKLTAVSLNSLTWQNVNAADTIILPSNSSSGAQTKLTYENSSWGFWKTTKENGELRNTRETNITIPVGTGFWYVSRGGSPTINWGNN